MPITLGSNIASLRGQRQLLLASNALSSTFERLSSGQRINRASDDAAGLAIADSLRNDARLFNVATRNINDGTSMINIMSSAISNQKGILLRLSELAEQSANGVYSDTQREALNGEYRALVQEFGRLGEATEFNGQQLLYAGRDGNAEEYFIQAGVDGSIDSVLQINGTDTGNFSGDMLFRADISGVGGDGIPDGNEDVNDLTYATNFQSSSPTLQDIADFSENYFSTTSIVDSDGEQQDVIGVILFGDLLVADSLTIGFFADDGSGETYENVGQLSNVALADLATDIQNVDLNFGSGATGSIALDYRGLDLTKDNTANTDNVTSIDFTGVETVSRARSALEVVGNRLDQLSQTEGQLGALQSRLDAAAKVVATSAENASAAESRIRDADIAMEAAELTRNNILQQAAAAVLSQANQQPALALQLLT